MKVKIIAISDSDKHFSSAIEEYLKRLGKDIEVIDIKPEKNGSREQIIQKENTKIIERIQKLITPGNQWQVVLLAKEGKMLNTEQFTKKLEQNTIFVIGGPYGLDLSGWRNIPHQQIAFGNITLPHGLAKLVLLEQIYRAKMITEGREYHY